MSETVNISLKEICILISGKLYGNENVFIKSLAKIEEAKVGDLTFLYQSSYEKFFPATKASAILVKPGFARSRSDISYIEVNEPEKAFAKVILHYFSPNFPLEGIDKTAFVHPTAKLGKDVALGKNVVISANSRIGDNVKIFHNTVLLENVEVGDNSLLFQNVSIRENCKLGKRVIIHPGTVIGSDGFGYQQNEKGEHLKVPQIGTVIIEDDVEIGSNVCIDRATLGSTVIKKGTKIDNLVQIAHNVTIGENSIVAGQAGIAGSTKVGKNCYILGQAGLAGHLEIADNVILLVQSGVGKSITQAGTYFGSPAKEIKQAFKLEAHYRNLPDYAERIKKLEEEIKILKGQLTKKIT